MKMLFTILFVVAIFSTICPQDTINVPADYTTIQAAIDASANGDIVLVAENTYFENINFEGKAITVASLFLIDGDTSHISNTIINGSQPSHIDSGSVVYFISGEDTTSVLCGFTVTRGHPGIVCDNSGMKIINNKITTNRNYFGGGIFIEAESNQCNIIIEKNTIDNNVAGGSHGSPGVGGGIYMVRTNGSLDGRISNNYIFNNHVYPVCNNKAYPNHLVRQGGEGGGIYISNCSPLINNNIITDNFDGGGVYLYGSNSHLLNNLIVSNVDGAIGIENSQPILINNTIVNNMDGIGIFENSNPIVINSILWNDATEIELGSGQNSVTISYSDIKDGLSGIINGGGTVYWLDGNIDAYPEFVDTANGDFHLADSSPCIGAAIDSIEISGTWYYCPLYDLEGNPRPNPSGTMPDIGALENGPMVGINDYLSQVPEGYYITQNFPNPFNPSTKIRYSIPQQSNVVIKVFDILGNEIGTLLNEEEPAGSYEITWYAASLPSGVYFYRLQAGDLVETKKMVLIK